MNTVNSQVTSGPQKWYMPYLLFIAGMGGLLYGIDVGVIAGALPYLQATTNYSDVQLSSIVAAVLLGSVLSSLFAGMLSDLLGRKMMMILSGLCFVASVPIICIPQGYEYLLVGRLLQGASAGFIGVVVPLYLAECLPANRRGTGTAMFQFLLTIGLVIAAAIGLYFAKQVDAVVATGIAEDIFFAKNNAWRSIFWACAVPGVIFTLGALFVSESPRWLFRRGKVDCALNVLRRSLPDTEAKREVHEMEENARKDASGGTADAPKVKDSILSRKYVVPFIIAVVILGCNQATGINSVLAYIVNILNQAGLPGSYANEGDLAIKILNCVMTIVAVLLVDRKGRKFLLTVGTSGIIIALLGVGFLFYSAEQKMEDYTPAAITYTTAAIPTMVTNPVALTDSSITDTMIVNPAPNFAVTFTPEVVRTILKDSTPLTGLTDSSFAPMQVKVAYKYGGIPGSKTVVVRPFEPAKEAVTDTAKANQLSDYLAGITISVSRADFLTANDDTIIGEFFRKIHMNPFPNPGVIKEGQFEITKLEVGPVPDATHGWLVTLCFAIFITAFAIGPGVCVWLALSELMPTRIRSNGMSIALLVNQFVSTAIAATFLPIVSAYGYSTIFFFCASCTVIYFITAAFFLPETKGKTLEEIEEYFSKKKKTN